MFYQNCETIQPIVRGESDTVLMVQEGSILNRNDRTADRTADRIATEVAQVRALENTGQAMLRTVVEEHGDVSIDEEMLGMLEAQRSYPAARFVAIVDDMMGTGMHMI
jgi:flagellar hook-associated protein FlgK